MMFLRTLLSLGLAALVATPVFAAQELGGTSKIRKCQDAQGRWHFGDYAAEECERSKITEMSGQGVKRGEIAAPPTAAELQQQDRQREELERERVKNQEQARRDDVLLSSYGGEQDIIYVRDRKLAQVQAAIKASEDTLTPLRNVLQRMENQLAEETRKGDQKAIAQSQKSVEQTKTQIARHEAIITAKRAEQEAIRKQYEEELARYRELKAKAPATSAPAPAAAKKP